MCDLYQNTLDKGEAIGMEKGMAIGAENGRKSMLIELVRQKLLTIQDAAAQLNISEEAFTKLMEA